MFYLRAAKKESATNITHLLRIWRIAPISALIFN